jgi:hypothetical protein
MSNYVTSRTTPVQKAISTTNDTADKIARNPLPVISTIVLTAVLTPYLGPQGAASASSAAVTYLNGGSPEDAAKAGAVSYVSYEAAEAYAPAAQKPDNIDVGGGFNPATGAGDPATASAAAATPTRTEKAGVSGATRGATSAALRGGSAEDVIAGGIVGGASSYGGAAASEELGFKPGSVESGLTQTIVGQSIGNYLSPTRSAQTMGGGSAPEPTSVATTGAGQAPGSQALSQALRIGDAGEPIFGGDKEEGKKSGWNVESLRYMGQEDK